MLRREDLYKEGRMKSKIYAIILITALFAGALGVFFFAAVSIEDTISAVAGFVGSLLLMPFLHEMGHVAFAKANGMNVVYVKFFCFCFYEEKGKMKFRIVSPTGADETRVVPKFGGDMLRRASAYVVGGMVFSGILLILLVAPAVVLTCLRLPAFAFWGMVPYTAYIFLLNVIPTQYAMGKTDMLVLWEIKKGTAEGRAFLGAMEIQGRLYAGERYYQIPEETYETYGLREDEPLYAALWDLKYHYFLEKGDLEKAADALNRLLVASEYLSNETWRKVQVEAAYMFLLQDDASALKSLLEKDEALLRSDDYSVKRLLATYAALCGEKERARALIEQAEILLEREKIIGVREHERFLLSRIDV